jgi:prophage maintenance system killer protein
VGSEGNFRSHRKRVSEEINKTKIVAIQKLFSDHPHANANTKIQAFILSHFLYKENVKFAFANQKFRVHVLSHTFAMKKHCFAFA